MNLGKLLFFMKELRMFDDKVTREEVTLNFVKRCPEKFADFGAFIDILYKIYKTSNFSSEFEILNNEHDSQPTRYQMFQLYIQTKIIDKQDQLPPLSEDSRSSFIKINTTETDLNKYDQQAFRVLEGYDETIKKVYLLINTFAYNFIDIQNILAMELQVSRSDNRQ